MKKGDIGGEEGEKEKEREAADGGKMSYFENDFSLRSLGI